MKRSSGRVKLKLKSDVARADAQMEKIITASFLDGLTGAGLFGKLLRPSAPTELIDSRTLDEFRASGELETNKERFHCAVEAMRRARLLAARKLSNTQPSSPDEYTEKHALRR